MHKDPGPLIALGIAFATADVLFSMMSAHAESPFVGVFLFALFVAQITLLGMWWAAGLASYWLRLFGTAAAIAAGCTIMVALASQGHVIGPQLSSVNTVTMFCVVFGGCAIFLLRVCGLRRYNLADPPVLDPSEQRLQFSLINMIQATTTVAIISAVGGGVFDNFREEMGLYILNLLRDFLLIAGFYTLVGIAAMLVMLTRGEVGPRLAIFFVVLLLAYLALVAIFTRGADAGYFILFGLLEGAILVAALGVVRGYGFRVTWSKSPPPHAPLLSTLYHHAGVPRTEMPPDLPAAPLFLPPPLPLPPPFLGPPPPLETPDDSSAGNDPHGSAAE